MENARVHPLNNIITCKKMNYTNKDTITFCHTINYVRRWTIQGKIYRKSSEDWI